MLYTGGHLWHWRNGNRRFLGTPWRISQGAEPDALKGARPVLNGGDEETGLFRPRLVATQLDSSAAMLAVSRRLNPDCQHVEGDMRSVRLVGRRFGGVLIHDAIMYMATEHDLAQAMETCFIHCRPGGASLFVPDYVRETFLPTTRHGGHDGGDHSLRYPEWAWDPKPSDSICVVDFAYLLRDTDNAMQVEHDRHICGLFQRADWLRLLSAVGFWPKGLQDPWGREVFLAVKPEN